MNYNTQPTGASNSPASQTTGLGKEPVVTTDGVTDAFFDAMLGNEVGTPIKVSKETFSIVDKTEATKSDKNVTEAPIKKSKPETEAENMDRFDTIREHEIGDQEIKVNETILADKKKRRKRMSRK